jgi:hypothetical protein
MQKKWIARFARNDNRPGSGDISGGNHDGPRENGRPGHKKSRPPAGGRQFGSGTISTHYTLCHQLTASPFGKGLSPGSPHRNMQ